MGFSSQMFWVFLGLLVLMALSVLFLEHRHLLLMLSTTNHPSWCGNQAEATDDALNELFFSERIDCFRDISNHVNVALSGVTFVVMSLQEAPQSKNQPVSWLWQCLLQLRLSNPFAHIILLQEKTHPWKMASQAGKDFGVTVCTVNSQRIKNAIGQDYRLHFLSPLMKKLNLSNVWHLEYDNMVYTNFSNVTRVASQIISNVAVTPLGFGHSIYRMTAGMMFVKDHAAADSLKNFSQMAISERSERLGNGQRDKNEMYDLGKIQLERGTSFLDSLPTLPYGLFTSSHCQKFGSLFDSGSYGQYLDGVGRALPLGSHRTLGHAASHHFVGHELVEGRIKLLWKKTRGDLWTPHILHTLSNRLLPLNNLHIYSKHLKEFLSNQTIMPEVPKEVVKIADRGSVESIHLDEQ